MTGECILVVDDEANIIQLTRLYLEQAGFQVQPVADGLSALSAVEKYHPALVVLDVMLPELDGFDVCRRLRAANNPVPIIMLTARDEDFDKILGLELGADDYMTKPFNPRELLARVKAILRRDERARAPQEEAVLRVGDLVVDVSRREVRCKGALIELRTQEFEVLLVFVRRPGQVFSREKLLELAWGYDYLGQTRTVDMHVAQLRRKLSASTVKIDTVTGVGYKLVI
jgi:DNA-binding response OmpR family regulator